MSARKSPSSNVIARRILQWKNHFRDFPQSFSFYEESKTLWIQLLTSNTAVRTLTSLLLNLNSWLDRVFGAQTSSHALGSYCCALTLLSTLIEILKSSSSGLSSLQSSTVTDLVRLSDVFYTNLRHSRTSNCPLLDNMGLASTDMHHRTAREIVDVCVIESLSELKHLLSKHCKYNFVQYLKSHVDFTNLKGRLRSNEMLKFCGSLYVDPKRITELASFLDSVVLKRLNRNPTNELLVCLCGCVSNLHDLASSKDEGVWGGINLLILRAFKTCEKLSRDRQLKSRALRCMAIILLRSRPEFNKSHMESFLRKRILQHLSNKSKVRLSVFNTSNHMSRLKNTKLETTGTALPGHPRFVSE